MRMGIRAVFGTVKQGFVLFSKHVKKNATAKIIIERLLLGRTVKGSVSSPKIIVLVRELTEHDVI